MPEPEPLLLVEVDRSRWLRGAGRGTGMPLLRHPLTHHMCCMGFACAAAGHSAGDIDGVPTIAHLAADAPAGYLDRRLRHFENTPENKPSAIRAPDPRMRHPSTAEWPVTQIIYSVNDDETLTDAERELYLRRLGPLVGIDFTFTGEALPPPDSVRAQRPSNERAVPRNGREGRTAATRQSGHQSTGPRNQDLDGRGDELAQRKVLRVRPDTRRARHPARARAPPRPRSPAPADHRGRPDADYRVRRTRLGHVEILRKPARSDRGPDGPARRSRREPAVDALPHQRLEPVQGRTPRSAARSSGTAPRDPLREPQAALAPVPLLRLPAPRQQGRRARSRLPRPPEGQEDFVHWYRGQSNLDDWRVNGAEHTAEGDKGIT